MRLDRTVPRSFRPARGLPVGRYPLLDVFRGLTGTVPFRKYPGDDASNRRVAASTWARISEGPGWMYVAPRKVPPEVRAAGYEMLTSDEDEIVVSNSYLRKGSLLDLYLDILHEFLHILQRRQGRELWSGTRVPYVDRPTEVEAFAYSVVEARRLGVPDSYLRRYLRVTWVSRRDYLRLLRHVGVRPTASRTARRR